MELSEVENPPAAGSVGAGGDGAEGTQQYQNLKHSGSKRSCFTILT